MSYLDLFGLVLVFLVLVIVAAVAWAAGASHGETVGRNQVADAEAVARAARNSKPGDLIPCRDPQAVAEALRNLRSQDYASPRNEIAYAVLLAVLPDPSVKMYGAARSQLVENCFGVADEFIKQADGRDA